MPNLILFVLAAKDELMNLRDALQIGEDRDDVVNMASRLFDVCFCQGFYISSVCLLSHAWFYNAILSSQDGSWPKLHQRAQIWTSTLFLSLLGLQVGFLLQISLPQFHFWPKKFSLTAGKRNLRFFLLIFQATFEFPCKLRKSFHSPTFENAGNGFHFTLFV